MEKELLEKYIADGLSQRAISETTGFSRTNVRYWLQKYNLNMSNYKNYSDEDILNIVPNVTSITALLLQLGLCAAGGNFQTMRRAINRLKPDTSHWTGHGWASGEKLKDWKDYHSINSIRRVLLNERGNKCEMCGITEWLNKPIKIDMHHIDGNRSNNECDNLQLLCPNCHSCTFNFRSHKSDRKAYTVIPDTEMDTIIDDIWKFSKIELAKRYNVCPTTIKNYCLIHKIKYPSIAYWNNWRSGNLEKCEEIKRGILSV